MTQALNDFDLNLDEEEEFPYPQRITRDAFAEGLTGERNDNSEFNVDKFLYDHYRFTLLDDAQNELTQLLKEVDQELFDLLNNDYYDFINLGKTLDGGEGLVDKLRISVVKYQKRLEEEKRKLDESSSHVRCAMENLNELHKIKTHAKNMILLDQFVNDFETLLTQNLKADKQVSLQLLKHLTSLFLTIHQLLKSLPTDLEFVETKRDKLEALRYEYMELLDNFIQSVDNEKNPEALHTILGIYAVIGEEKHAVGALKNRKRK